jgi:hypothetical protein
VGKSVRVAQGFVVAAGLCVASHAAQAAQGECYLSVDSRTYLNGRCNVILRADGSFSIGAGEHSRSRFFAYVNMVDGQAWASWNGVANSNHAEVSLGTVVRQGGCWVNSRAKVCAWRPGTRPKTF